VPNLKWQLALNIRIFFPWRGVTNYTGWRLSLRVLPGTGRKPTPFGPLRPVRPVAVGPRGSVFKRSICGKSIRRLCSVSSCATPTTSQAFFFPACFFFHRRSHPATQLMFVGAPPGLLTAPRGMAGRQKQAPFALQDSAWLSQNISAGLDSANEMPNGAPEFLTKEHYLEGYAARMENRPKISNKS